LFVFVFIPLFPRVHFSAYFIFQLKFQLSTEDPTLTTQPKTLWDALASRCFAIPFRPLVGCKKYNQ